jgi:uncharacterized membrane protein YagU involved in acid resistance
MNVPYMLGTVFVPGRDRARVVGFVAHLGVGLLFALLYVGVFQAAGSATWWAGALCGLVHAVFVLTVGMAILPSLHPRMASEEHGPSAPRQLEPPGFLALHYGVRTPISVVIAHVLYGAILGAGYHVR